MQTVVIDKATGSDWQTFFAWADLENWRIPAAEKELFTRFWQDRAYTLRYAGNMVGFVTAVRHGQSGWIGNLIVPPSCRRGGIGSTLLDYALQQLTEQGCTTIWLTASAMGRPLYERRGFRRIDRIERWILPNGGRGDAPPAPSGPLDDLRTADQSAWGDSRQELLERLAAYGRVVRHQGGVALLQQQAATTTPESLQVLGPWYASPDGEEVDARLLDRAIAQATPSGELIADCLFSSGKNRLLAERGFLRHGTSELMVRGDHPGLGPNLISLASLGSIG